MIRKTILAGAVVSLAALCTAETVATEKTVTTTNNGTTVQSTTPAATTVGTVTTAQPATNVTVTQPASAANVTVTAPGTGTGVVTATSPATVTYETRAEAAYRAAGIPDNVIVKLRDYDVKIRDARIANDTALVKQYYTEEGRLLSSQQIGGITTYLKANPVTPTSTAAVTVWEDPAYVSVASPATVINPTTIVTNEVRTPPVVTRQVQVPVVQGSVPVVVRDPVPVVQKEASVSTVKVVTTPAVNTVTQTEEVTKIRTESKNKESKSSEKKSDKND